jgi:hypothetical protein
VSLFLPVLLEVLKRTFLRLLLGSTILTLTLLEVLFGMSWLASFLGGCCLGVLGETLMSFVFQLKDRVMFA